MGDNYEAICAEVQGYIEQMKENHVSSLIIDVRNNAGVIIAEQFAKEDLFYLQEATYDATAPKYIEKQMLRMNAKASSDLLSYLFVNSNCMSAGEGFDYNMAKLPQVTVVGMQGTNGSFGTIEGVSMMPEGMITAYPSIACLDENGEVMIDSKQNGLGGVKPDIVIPIDREAVKKLHFID